MAETGVDNLSSRDVNMILRSFASRSGGDESGAVPELDFPGSAPTAASSCCGDNPSRGRRRLLDHVAEQIQSSVAIIPTTTHFRRFCGELSTAVHRRLPDLHT